MLTCCYSEFVKQQNCKKKFIINRSLFFNVQFKCFYTGDLQDFPFNFMLEKKNVYFKKMKCIQNISLYLLFEIVVMKILNYENVIFRNRIK